MKTTLTSLNSMAKKAPPTIKEVEARADEILSRWDTNRDGSISLDEFKSFVSKDPDILRLLLSYGLINKEEMRPDFGGNNPDIPECDSDLEEELHRDEDIMDERTERIKLGIEHNLNDDDMFGQEGIEGGDQFLAVKPWVGTVKATVPSDYKPSKGESDAPEATLDLEYVYGYRCHDTRNNLRYNKDGDVVYHTAAVGITLNAKSNTQKFFINHTDDIVAFDVWGDWVVTGQLGKKPLVCVWDSVSMESLVTFVGELQNSITHVCFSPDGKKIAAIANDPDHTIAIYNLEKFMNPNYNRAKAKTDGSIILGKGPKAEVLDLKFDPSGTSLIAACVKEVDFITFEGGIVKCVKGTGWGKNPPQAVTCIGFMDQSVITGTFSGSLFVWKGKPGSIANTIQAHTGNINAIWTRKTQQGIITGGNDGLIIVWDQSIKKVAQLDLKMPAINSMLPKVRSVCEGPNGNILVGTRGGEIVEFVGNTPKVLMRGHYDQELWGLAVHSNPKKNEFFTVGQDCMLACWDINSRKQKLATKLEYKATVLAMSPDEKFLAVGCMNGFVLIINPTNFNLIQTLKDRTKQISDIKFSPNGELLAVGAHDAETFVYNVKKNFKIQCKARGHHSTITHIDFAEDSQFFQSNCTSYELLFFSTSTGKRVNAPQFRDEKWASWTCVIGWPVQGIWPPCSDGSDINAVDRHPAGNVLATADDFSHVKLFKYPCPVEKSSYVKYVGHSSHVTNVRFTKAGNYLISTGGADKAIFQWKYEFNKEADQQAQNIHDAIPDEEEANEAEAEEGLFQEEEVQGGDEALAVKAFKGQVEKSTPDQWKKPPRDAADAPNGNLTLKYCHGYRCFDGSKNTVKYTSDPSNIVFVGAALGVVMNTSDKSQSFFQMHEEDVICLAVNPQRKLAATGQMARKGKAKAIDMFVWDIETKTMLARLNNFHLRAVCLIEFSPNGSKLLSIGRDDYNSLAVYDWAQRRILCTSKVDQAKVTACGFKSETEFFTCGLKHIKFYTLNGQNVKATRGQLPQTLQAEAFLTGTYAFGSICVCGTQSGNLIPFSGGSALKAVMAHQGGVSTVCAYKNNLFSGGQDGKIIMWSWNNGLTKVGEVFCNMANFTSFPSAVVSIDVHPESKEGTVLLVGTRGGQIFEVTKNGKSANLILQGHYNGELWGLAVHPSENKFVTCGGDSTIRLWDIKSYSMITSTKPLENDVRSIDWSSNGAFIVAGDMKGKIMLYDPEKLTLLDSLQSSFTKKDQWIEDIKVSPDNTMVAFGAHGGASPIEIMSVQNNRKLTKLKKINAGLTSALLHLDWSTDSNIILVNSQAYELLFISVQTEKQVTASATKDIEWATWTSKIGWPVQGIFKGVDYTDTNTCHRANNQKVLVTGDDDGYVNLFKYPSVVERSKYKAYIGHSSHVTRTRFTFNDARVISTGGNDKCVLIWETDFGTGDPGEGDLNLEVDEIAGGDEAMPSDIVQRKAKKDKYGRGKTTKVQDEDIEEPEANQGGDNFFQVEEVDGGDEFLAVKPWIGQMKEPTGYKKPPLNQNKPPKVDLTLEYVHGYRAKDCRNNLRYLKNGGIVYHAAALGIVLDPPSSNNPVPTQRFFNLHTDDITAMDVHPNGILVATGEIGPKPCIYVWDSNSMQAIFKFKGRLEKGICNLGFSPSGSRLVAVAIDNDHSIGVYDTEVGVELCADKGDTNKIVDVKFKNENVIRIIIQYLTY